MRRGRSEWRLAGAIVLCLLAGWVRAAELVICRKCGHEGDGGTAACAHCGAALPAARPVEPAPAATNEPVADPVSALAAETVRVDRKLAAEFAAERPALSYALRENAIAASRLVRREGAAADAAGARLAAEIEQARLALTQAARTCPSCNGAGKRAIQFQQLNADKSTQSAGGLACLTCEGRGVIRAGRSADELRVLIAQGRRDYDVRMQAMGRVSCGRAWLPADLATRLTVRQQALVRTACPTPCKDCMGLGVQDCGRCKGATRLKCTGEGCQNGLVVRKESNTLSSKVTLNRRETCAVCNGSGFMACPDCRGAGTVPCRTCLGTGRNQPCTDCGGQGWTPCNRCRGAGKQADGSACPDCQGQNDRLCARCRGEGCTPR